MFYSCMCLVVTLLGGEHLEYFHHDRSFYRNKLVIPMRSSWESENARISRFAVRERDDRTEF